MPAHVSCKTVLGRLAHMKDIKLSQQRKIMPFAPNLTTKDPCREIPWEKGETPPLQAIDCRIAEVVPFMVNSLLTPGLHDIRSYKIQSFNRSFLCQWFQLPIFWRVVWNNQRQLFLPKKNHTGQVSLRLSLIQGRQPFVVRDFLSFIESEDNLG